MGIHGILFDLDGVLVFTDKYHYQAWKELADLLGIPFDEKINDRLRGVSRMESLEIILENAGDRTFTPEEKAMFAEKKNASYRKLLEQMQPSDVDDEVRETLTMLHDRGYLLALGSSSKNARYIMERTALTDYFDGIVDGTNITKSKPDPEVFVKAAGRLNLKPEECAVIEDADAGIRAAKDGGMLAVAIGENVTENTADYNISGLGQLLKIFS